MGRQATPFGRYTGARHAGRDKYTTHIGNDRFAWFATRPSKSRLNFLDLLRAGHPDYVINATALAYLVEHGVPDSIVAALLAAGPRSFVDDAAWQAHLDSLELGAGHPSAGQRGGHDRSHRRPRPADRHGDRLR